MQDKGVIIVLLFVCLFVCALLAEHLLCCCYGTAYFLTVLIYYHLL